VTKKGKNMSVLAIHYDDSLLAALNESHIDFENEARKAMALKLFELGRLTSGQAAQMAGMTRVDFLLECPRYGSPSVVWDEEELTREFGTRQS
jgi:predicted HTH domain antitoxin